MTRLLVPFALLAAVCMTLMTMGQMYAPVPSLPADVPDLATIRALVRWDAGWYGEIAQNGYWLRPGEQSPVAFFPLYPTVIHGFVVLGVNRWIAGIVVSLACSLIALMLFSKWATRIKPEQALTAVWLLALYPFAEYLYGVVYSDALFLVLSVAAFLSLEKDRPVLAAVFGALACTCRPVAPAVVIGLTLRSIERRRAAGQKIRVIDLVPGLAGLGLLAFMAYLYVRFDDPLAFAHVQGVKGWDQPPGWQSWLKLPWFKTMFPRVAPEVAFRLGGHALVTLLALAMVVPTYKRLGYGYGTYCLIAVGLPALSSKDFQGLGRYVIAAFPLFLTTALLFEKRPRLRMAFTVVSAVLLGVLSFLLGTGAYVA